MDGGGSKQYHVLLSAKQYYHSDICKTFDKLIFLKSFFVNLKYEITCFKLATHIPSFSSNASDNAISKSINTLSFGICLIISKAFDIIKQIPKDKVLIDLEIALSDAFEENDGIWVANLKQVISYFRFTKKDFKKINLSKVLQISEW